MAGLLVKPLKLQVKKLYLSQVTPFLRGLDLEDLVDVQCGLTNMKQDFKTFNKVYAELFY